MQLQFDENSICATFIILRHSARDCITSNIAYNDAEYCINAQCIILR